MQEDLDAATGRAMKGYLRIEPDQETGGIRRPGITTDEDPDETTIVLDIKKVYLITDQTGNIIQTP